MEEPASLLLILAIFILLILSAFFSGSETALLSFPRLRLKHLARKGDRRAVVILALLKRPDRLLGTILVGNNLVNTAAVSIATYLVASWMTDKEQAVLITTVVMTLLLLIFGEITPKTFAARHPEGVSFFITPLIRGIMALLSPIVRGLTFFTNRLLNLFKVEKSEFFPSLSEEEIRSIIHMGYEEGVVGKEKRRMLHAIFRMGETMVKDVMLPRGIMTALEVNTPLSKVVEVIRATGHSRIPVYEGELENIIGVVHTKDLIGACQGDFDLRRVMRKPYFVPESARIGTVLRDMQKRRVHLALVVDEYGGLEGMVTLEDILEEIVGEIRDEYDIEEKELITTLPDGTALVDGKASINDINEALNLSIEPGPDHTLAGFILTKLGRIPEAKEELIIDGLKLSIEEVSRRTIKRVRVQKVDPGGN